MLICYLLVPAYFGLSTWHNSGIRKNGYTPSSIPEIGATSFQRDTFWPRIPGATRRPGSAPMVNTGILIWFSGRVIGGSVQSHTQKSQCRIITTAAISQWRTPYFNLKMKVQLHSILAHKPLRCRRLFMRIAVYEISPARLSRNLFPFRTVWRRFLNVITLNTYNCSKGSCLLWSLEAGALKRQLVWEKCWLELLLTSHNGCRIAFFLSRNMAGNSRLGWIFSLLVGLHFLFNLKYRLVVFVSIV